MKPEETNNVASITTFYLFRGDIISYHVSQLNLETSHVVSHLILYSTSPPRTYERRIQVVE